MKESFTQNFYPEFKLHKLIEHDELRPALNYIWFYNGYAYATDAHILTRASLKTISNFPEDQLEHLNEKALDPRNFQQILKHKVVTITEEGIVADEELKTITYKFHKGDEKHPDFDKVLKGKEETEPVTHIGFKAGLLNRVTDAIGIEEGHVILEFQSSRDAIFVTSPNLEDVTAILMPMID